MTWKAWAAFAAGEKHPRQVLDLRQLVEPRQLAEVLSQELIEPGRPPP